MEAWRGRRDLVAALLSPPTVNIKKLGGRTQAKDRRIKETNKSSTSPKFNSICSLCLFKDDDDESFGVVPLIGMETLRGMMTQVGLDFGDEGDLIFCHFCSSHLLHLVALKRDINALGERLASMIIGLRSLLSSHLKSKDSDPCDAEAEEDEEMPYEEEVLDIKPDLMETNSQKGEEGTTGTEDLEGSSKDSPRPSPNTKNSDPSLDEERTGEEDDTNGTLPHVSFLETGKEQNQPNRPTTATTAVDNLVVMDFVTPTSPSTEKTTPSNDGSDEGETHGRINHSTKEDMRRNGPIVNRSLCPTCGKTCPNGGPYRRHLLTHSIAKPHSCHLCHKSFTTRQWLRVHLKVFHTAGGNVKRVACPKCPKAFRTRAELRQHSYSHEGVKKPCVCQICGKGFIRPSDLKTHTLIHTRNQPHVCHICPSSFRLTGHLRVHLAMAHPGQVEPSSNRSRVKSNTLLRRRQVSCKPFPQAEVQKALTYPDPNDPSNVVYTCQTCGKVFKCKQIFKTHMQGVHWKEQVCQCQICGMVFQSKMGLWLHAKVCPPGQEDQDTQCRARSCGLVFASVEQRKAHQREVHKKRQTAVPVKCAICQRFYTNPEAFKAHTHPDPTDPKRIHYPCIPCGSVFNVSWRYLKHMRMEHGTNTSCYFCNKSLHGTSLLIHIRSHTLERPFHCPKCGREFQLSISLKRHMITSDCSEKDEKSSKSLLCLICNRQYRHSEAFKAHTHPGMGDSRRVEYPCHVCGRVFSLSQTFMRHIRVVHKN